MRISDWSSDVCSSDLQADFGRQRWKIGGAAPGRETAELRRLRQPGRAREDWHQIGQLGARAVRGEPIFGAQEIVERTALRVRNKRLGLCPALAAACGVNPRVEKFFLISEERRCGKGRVSTCK